MNTSQTIKKWIEVKGGQAPLIVMGYNQKEIKALIEEIVSSGVQNKIISSMDVTTIETEKSTISIKQIKGLLEGLSKMPVRLRRIVIIYDAHKLSLPAANALLKSLEEAPQYVRFILVTSWGSRLPTTILSRCTRIRVNSDNKLPELVAKEVEHIKQSLKENRLEHEDVEVIGKAISGSLRVKGPSNELKMATMRLVDYYRVKGSGGNEKLAREVLLTYLPYN